MTQAANPNLQVRVDALNEIKNYLEKKSISKTAFTIGLQASTDEALLCGVNDINAFKNTLEKACKFRCSSKMFINEVDGKDFLKDIMIMKCLFDVIKYSLENPNTINQNKFNIETVYNATKELVEIVARSEDCAWWNLLAADHHDINSSPSDIFVWEDLNINELEGSADFKYHGEQ